MKAFFEQKTFVHSWSIRVTEKMRGQYPEFIEMLNETAWTVPEISYWSFSFYEIIIPFLLARRYAKRIPIPIKLDFSWSLIDGIASIGIGLTQIFDTETHRPWSQRMKGIMNVSNGLQLILVCALLSPAAPIAFVVASLVDFILSLETLSHEFNRRYSFGYWLKDRLAELKKREAELLAISEEISMLKQRTDKESIFYQDMIWLIEQKQSRIEKIVSQMQQIGQQIIIRFIADPNRISFFQNVISENDFISRALNHVYIKPSSEINPFILSHAQKEEKKIIQHLFDELLYAATETSIFALVTTGWILLCLSSPQLPAVLLILVTAGFYLLKNSVQLYRSIYPKKIEEIEQIPYAEDKHSIAHKQAGNDFHEASTISI